jgi:hypothetical protein
MTAKKAAAAAEEKPTKGPERVRQLAEDGCTNEEIARDQEMTVESLEEQYPADLESGRLQRRLTVRGQMYQFVKEKANATITRYIYEHELPPSGAGREGDSEDGEDAAIRALSDDELDEEIRLLHGDRDSGAEEAEAEETR